jgi:putative ABC transport system permease protein
MESARPRISIETDRMLLSRLRYAWRTLTKNKSFTAINITGLATGICACMVIYILTSYEFGFDNFHPHGERIYRVGARIAEHDSYQYGEDVAPPTAEALRREIPGIEAAARYYTWSIDDTNAILTDNNYFGIFPYQWLAGSPITALSYPFSVVLTESQARKYFGHGPYLGREIVYQDSLHVHVTGVVRDWTGNTDFPYTDLISLSTINASPFLKSRFHPDSWQTPLRRNPWTRTLIRLAPHADPARITAQLAPFVTRHMGKDPDIQTFHLAMVLQPLADIHFNNDYSHDGGRKAQLPILYGLIAAATFVLLLAIVNFINLSTAQSMRRAHETQIRRVLGSSRGMLMFRFLTETALVTTMAGVLSLLLVYPVLNLLQTWLPPDLRFHPFDLPVLFFILGIIAGTTLLAGIYPARVLSVQGISRRYTVRKALIVFQFTISLGFIIGSIGYGKQLHYMLTADPGFLSKAIITITDFGDSPEQLQLFAQKARQLAAVKDLIVQGHPPGASAIIEIPLRLENRKDKEELVSLFSADKDFLGFYQIPLLAGRNLRDQDSSHEVIINEAYRNKLGFKTPADAVGHFIAFQDQTWPIVGVIADFHTNSFHDPIYPLLIGKLPHLRRSIALKLSPGSDMSAALARLQKIWKTQLPGHPFEYHFLDESISRQYAADIRLSWLVHAATALTILISCMGLFGLILYTVERKKKEISIRKVLGAGVTDIVLLLNREFAALIGIALLIASPLAAIALHQWLRGFAYRTTVSWWVFVLAGLIALVVASLTISVRVIRAALVNPATHLRSE